MKIPCINTSKFNWKYNCKKNENEKICDRCSSNLNYNMCQHKNDIAYCISCSDTICIECIRNDKTCTKCYCLYYMNKCQTCNNTCHSDSYICDFCDYNCCKLCLRKQLEKSINDFVCPNKECSELLTVTNVVKILGLPWFNGDYKKYKKRTLYDIAMLKKSDKKVECKLCGDMCTVSNTIVECKNQEKDTIYDIKTMEIYDPVILVNSDGLRPAVKQIYDKYFDEYNQCLEIKPKLDKYRDRIEIDLFKIHKAQLKCREIIDILIEVNDLGKNEYKPVQKINKRLETLEKCLKIKCFHIEIKFNFPEIIV